MLPLNRIALIVRPKRRFVEWVNGLGTVKPKLTIEEARTNPSVYLVVNDDGDRDGPVVAELVDAYGTELYEAELGNWSEQGAWPADLSPHAFQQHFDVEVAEVVEDVDDDEPLDQDPEAADEALSEEELEKVTRVMTECAWCGAAIPEPQPVLPILFEAFQPETLDAEGPTVPFPLPRAGRTLTGVRQDRGAHAHGPWCDHDLDEDEEDDGALDVEAEASTAEPPPPAVLLGVCSEKCRAKLVVAVEEEKEAR